MSLERCQERLIAWHPYDWLTPLPQASTAASSGFTSE